MKQLMFERDIDNKIITTTKTKPKDVFNDTDIVLAVNRNDKITCYIVKENRICDSDYNEFRLITPYYWSENSTHYEYLYEIQRFYDLFIFENIDSLHEYMNDNRLQWANYFK